MQKEWDESYDKYFQEQLDKIFTINEIASVDELSNVKDAIKIVSDYSDGFAVARYSVVNGKFFFVNANKYRTSNKTYEDAKPFVEGFAKVRVDGKWTFVNEQEEFITNERFDAAYDFENGVAIVARAGKYNYLDTNGKILLDEWYSSVNELKNAHPIKGNKEEVPLTKGIVLDGVEVDRWELATNLSNYKKDKLFFKDGLAPIKIQLEDRYGFHKSMKYNFFNWLYRPISEIWFDKIHEVIDGFAVVELGGKFSLLCKNGKLLENEWFKDATNFIGDYALLGDHYVDKKGNRYQKEDYPNGVKKLTFNGESFLLKPNGKIINNTRYSEIGAFNQGFAYIKKLNGLYNYIDRNYNEVSDKDFTYASDFNYGRAVVGLNNKYYFIDTKFNQISEKYDSITTYGVDYAIVELNGKYSVLDANLHTICTDWYDSITKYSDGYARVEKDGEYSYIDMEGNPLVSEWYAYAEEFTDGCAIVGVVQNNRIIYNLIDKNGHEILDDWTVDKPNVVGKKGDLSLIKSSGKEIVHFNRYDMGDYQVKKTFGLSVYRCFGPHDSFSLKYEPIKQYGPNYYACRDNKNQIYLFNRSNNSYEYFGYSDNVSIDDNLLVARIGFNYKAYLLYDNKAFNISEYYEKNLQDQSYKIDNGYEFYTKDEYFQRDEDSIREKHRENERKKEEEENKKRERERDVKLADIKRRREIELEKLEEKKEETKSSLAENAAFFREYERKTGIIERTDTEGEWLMDYGDYKIINPAYVAFGLKYVDLADMPTDDVMMRGLDFKDSNISLTGDDPQKVFNSDLSNCNFEGVFIPAGTIFTGVNICGAKFSIITTGKSMGISALAFQDAIYDERTMVDGKPLIELLKEYGVEVKIHSK